MNGCDGLATHDTAAKLAVLRLLMTYNATLQCQLRQFLIKGASWNFTRVQRSKPMQPLLELRREAIISFHLTRKQSVATLIRCIEDVEKRRARRLVLIRHIRVPGDSISPGLEEVLSAIIVHAAIYEMDLWMAWGSSTGGVNVQAAEILSDLEGFVDGEIDEVLVAEDCSSMVNRLSLTHTSRETDQRPSSGL